MKYFIQYNLWKKEKTEYFKTHKEYLETLEKMRKWNNFIINDKDDELTILDFGELEWKIFN